MWWHLRRCRDRVLAFRDRLLGRRRVRSMAELSGGGVVDCEGAVPRGKVIASAEDQRVHGAVVFCDMSDFTWRSKFYESLEARARWTNTLFSWLGDLCLRRDGTFDKVMGDGFMAVFAAELGCRDPGRSALRFAIDALVAEVDQHRDAYLHIGVSYGEMLLHLAGPSFAMMPTVTGDSVNLAARLASVEEHRTYGGRSIAVDAGSWEQFRSGVSVPKALRLVPGRSPIKGFDGQKYTVIARADRVKRAEGKTPPESGQGE